MISHTHIFLETTYIQGCVRGEDLGEFHPYYDQNNISNKRLDGGGDNTPGFASYQQLYSLFVAAIIITIVGFVIVLASTIWCLAAGPRAGQALPFSTNSSTSNMPVAQPLYMQPFSSPPPPAQEMAHTSYPHMPPPNQGDPGKPNPNLRM